MKRKRSAIGGDQWAKWSIPCEVCRESEGMSMGANNLEPQFCCFEDGKVALRKVGRKGFCTAHMEEAWAAARSVNNGFVMIEESDVVGGAGFPADYDPLVSR